MDNSRLEFLFYRYVNNTCTAAERKEFLNYVNHSLDETQLDELMERLWDHAPELEIPQGRRQSIVDEILHQDSAIPENGTESRFPWFKIAASLILAIICAGVLFNLTSRDGRLSTQSAYDDSTREAPRFIDLPDGSSVILNAGSELEYPASFRGQAREVSLKGEGYFDIAHDAQRPFIVHTGKLKTTVLGTAFNIKAYPDQSDIIVTVTRGKVKVSNDEAILGIINPDQQITFNRNDEHTEQKKVDSHTVTAWVEKDIFFDDITIGQAIDQLEKRFSISVEMTNDRIANCRFTATFVKGEDIVQILRILCDFNRANLIENGPGSFVIEGGDCPL